jgi:hypothetical protein
VTDRVLIPHGGGAEGCSVVVRVAVAGSKLLLEYRLRADLAQLAIPRRTKPQRADRLWEHTCFEAFVAPAKSARYNELNFSPSTQWAAYAFDGYRNGMRPLAIAEPPAIAIATTADELRVTAGVELAAFADAPWPWRIGLTAVVEDRAGSRAYFALGHPRDEPDFHDAAAFTVILDGSTG